AGAAGRCAAAADAGAAAEVRGAEAVAVRGAGAGVAGALAGGMAAVGEEAAAAPAGGGAPVGGAGGAGAGGGTAPGGAPARAAGPGSDGSFTVGPAVGFGGKVMRTVSFFGWTFAASLGRGGTAPLGGIGVLSAIL